MLVHFSSFISKTDNASERNGRKITMYAFPPCTGWNMGPIGTPSGDWYLPLSIFPRTCSLAPRWLEPAFSTSTTGVHWREVSKLQPHNLSQQCFLLKQYRARFRKFDGGPVKIARPSFSASFECIFFFLFNATTPFCVNEFLYQQIHLWMLLSRVSE